MTTTKSDLMTVIGHLMSSPARLAIAETLARRGPEHLRRDANRLLTAAGLPKMSESACTEYVRDLVEAGTAVEDQRVLRLTPLGSQALEFAV